MGPLEKCKRWHGIVNRLRQTSLRSDYSMVMTPSERQFFQDFMHETQAASCETADLVPLDHKFMVVDRGEKAFFVLQFARRQSIVSTKGRNDTAGKLNHEKCFFSLDR